MTQLIPDTATQRRAPVHAGKSGYEHYRREFIRLFRDTARYHHRHEVFRDFAEMATLAVQNAFLRSPELENEYLAIAGRYQPEDMKRMAQLLGCLTGALECQPGDFLGAIFMELEIGSTHMGQFFTPYSLSQMMARLTAGDFRQQLEHQPFITLQEPAAAPVRTPSWRRSLALRLCIRGVIFACGTLLPVAHGGRQRARPEKGNARRSWFNRKSYRPQER